MRRIVRVFDAANQGANSPNYVSHPPMTSRVHLSFKFPIRMTAILIHRTWWVFSRRLPFISRYTQASKALSNLPYHNWPSKIINRATSTSEIWPKIEELPQKPLAQSNHSTRSHRTRICRVHFWADWLLTIKINLSTRPATSTPTQHLNKRPCKT